MRIESDGHSRGNPRLFELIEHAPKTGKSPTVWAWPELIDYLKIAGQPVPGPWPPHQQPRPDPEEDSLPVAVADTGPFTPRPPAFAEPAAPDASYAEPVPPDTSYAEPVPPDASYAEPAAPAAAAAADREEPGPPTPALGGSEAADEESAQRHPRSSLGPNPYGH
jgi:hypothetical protein